MTLRALKVLVWAAIWAWSPAALAQAQGPTGAEAGASPGDAKLRAELTQLLRAGSPEAAVRQAQAALARHPHDAGVRQEYVALHLVLARQWLAARQYDAARSALEAVLAVEPQQAQAVALRDAIEAARGQADEQLAGLDELLRLELFEAALDRVNELKALRPDRAEALASRERAAWLGAADDHYLARNFNEAFVLYERVLAGESAASRDVRVRWATSLALALAGGDFSKPADPDNAARLLTRAVDELRDGVAPVVGQVVGGLLAEMGGELLEAGQMYAEAAEAPWELPPADQRREKVAELRAVAIQRVREAYQATPTRRRDGMWAVALPGVWKQRTTPHFDVYARSDLIAARVADTLEYHYGRLAEWLGVATAETWDPRLEVRVYGTQDEFSAATGVTGMACAVSHTRLQGDRVLFRKLEVFQADPWLLCATLPHELTHALLREAQRRAAPLFSMDEGLALQAEPPARRLMYRRLLAGPAPDPTVLLAAAEPGPDVERFYAQVDALTSWLLDRAGQRLTATQPVPIPALLAALARGAAPGWWENFGWPDRAAMQADWQGWYQARGSPRRMPLMIQVAPAAKGAPDSQGGSERVKTP